MRDFSRRLAILVLLLSFTGPASAQIPAHRADDFVDSIGVCTHWGYPDTPYGYAYENIKALLSASGIRHVRDGMHERLRDLWASHGIRATVIFGPGNAVEVLRTVRDNRPIIAMIEGPNEVAVFPQSAAYQGVGYPEGPRRWMDDLYKALKADPEVRNIPVIAPSTGRAGANVPLAPLRSFDYAVMHSYAGGGTPSSSLYGTINNNITDAYDILGKGATLKPLVVTESGYHTALGSNVVIGGAQPGVSEKAQAKYLPRHFAEYFNAGIVRTFTYEFVDEFEDYKTDEREATNAEACFGIIKRDLTPKPAYRAVRNLIALLNEARWDTVSRAWVRPAPNFSPRALTLGMPDAPETVHYTLLQKAGGDYFLLIWQEVPSFDTGKREDVAVPPLPVTLTVPQPSEWTVYRPGESVNPVGPTKTLSTSFTLPVLDEVQIVRIKLPEKALPSAPPAPKIQVSGTATNDSVGLAWKDTGKNSVSGYFVYRLGKYLGKAEGNQFKDTKLLPGVGYPYSLIPFDAQGRTYPAINVTIQTRNEVADLVVESVGFAETPRPGQPVFLTAKIVNRGTAPSPEGIVHGVAFYVDDQFICWSDTFSGPLKPRESRVVTSNSGPKGVAHWDVVAGMHKLRAVVDDVRRIPERSDENNTLEQTITVAP